MHRKGFRDTDEVFLLDGSTALQCLDVLVCLLTEENALLCSAAEQSREGEGGRRSDTRSLTPECPRACAWMGVPPLICCCSAAMIWRYCSSSSCQCECAQRSLGYSSARNAAYGIIRPALKGPLSLSGTAVDSEAQRHCSRCGGSTTPTVRGFSH
jgi:hypothetical protein